MSFAERLKKERARLGKTQQGVADALGVRTATLSAWENGTSSPTVAVVEDLIRIGFDSTYLLTGVRIPDWSTKHHVSEDAARRTLDRARASLYEMDDWPVDGSNDALAAICRDLQEVVASPLVGSEVKAEADMLLSEAFADQRARDRVATRQRSIAVRYRNVSHAIKRTAQVVNFDLSDIIEQALLSLCFRYDIDDDTLTDLMSALKKEFDTKLA